MGNLMFHTTRSLFLKHKTGNDFLTMAMNSFGMRPGIILLREGTDSSQVKRHKRDSAEMAYVAAAAAAVNWLTLCLIFLVDSFSFFSDLR